MHIRSFVKQHRGLTTLALCAVLVAFLFALPPLGLRVYYMHILIGVFIWIIVASSLRVLDLSGQGSIGHAACAWRFISIGPRRLGWGWLSWRS